MKGMAAATVPAVSAMPLAAASGCPGRTISSACARPTSGALSAGVPVSIGSAAPGSVATTPGTATVHFSKLGPLLDDAKGRTLYLPEAAKCDTATGDTNDEESKASGATVVRRQRIRQQGRTRLIGER